LQESVLGAGHYGKVYYGTVKCKSTGQLLPVGVKVAKFENCDLDEMENNESIINVIRKQIETLRIELNILSYIQRQNGAPHPNLIRLIGAITIVDGEFMLITEYCEYGSLDCYLRKKYYDEKYDNEIVLNNADRCVWKVANRY